MALLRRLEKRILVPLPEAEARAGMITKHIGPQLSPSINPDAMAARTELYSGSDLKLLCKEAAMKPVRRLLKTLETNQDEDSTALWHRPAEPAAIPEPEKISV